MIGLGLMPEIQSLNSAQISLFCLLRVCIVIQHNEEAEVNQITKLSNEPAFKIVIPNVFREDYASNPSDSTNGN